MRTNLRLVGALVLTLLFLAGFLASARADEVSIPDPGLNAAIREALQIPNGPLSEQDLLGLTNLNAGSRNISNPQGLEAARNLVSLNLEINHLTNFSLPNTLTNLAVLDLRSNSLTSFSVPGGPTNLTSLDLSHNLFTSFSLPPNLAGLTSLDLGLNALTNVSLPGGLTNLTSLVIRGNNLLTDLNLPPDLTALRTLGLDNNLLGHLSLPAGMRSLLSLNLEANQLFSLSLPSGMTNLVELVLERNHLDSLSLPADLTKLAVLDLFANQLTNVTLPGSLTALINLELAINRLTSFALPGGLTNLANLDLFENTLTSFTLPAGLTALTNLDLGVNQLTSFTMPPGATNLLTLSFFANQLTNVSLPVDLRRLNTLGLSSNRLRSLDLPSGLTALAFLNLGNNQLTNLTLPPDMQALTGLFVNGNPLATLVLSEPLAATNLAGTVASLRSQGSSVFTYPLEVKLISPRQAAGAFEFTLIGPPGAYSLLATTNLVTWSPLGAVTDQLGSIVFTDATAHLSPLKFYRALLQSPPPNMVFIPAGTFAMGTPANEVNRQSDEGPQVAVTISRGFWMGKYEVTQREYQAVTGSNPSGFPGDLNRPVERVSWLDATNYCARLTQQEFAAGRIPPGAHYRLPTEAEWEYAARAGTTTRFSYGDDPNFVGLTNHAWYWANSGFGTHPVGQKAPNPWGLYDMEGNVWEWCQDWYSPYPGGSVTDPQGPASNPQGVKVIRGGAWDAGEADCRSGRRLTEGVSPFITDFILGFRVVLIMEPQ